MRKGVKVMKKITALILAAVCMLSSVSAFAAADVAALMYHSVTPSEDRWSDYTISPQQLEEDIQYFTDRGYVTMTATELAQADISAIDGGKILLLTFDDGYSNFYTEIYPILKKHNAKATMFLIGSYINRYGYLTAEQVREMSDSPYVEIGNHTNSLHNASREVLNSFYNNPSLYEEILSDIQKNREMLKDIAGKEITSMSWPYGLYTEKLDSALKNRFGYKITFSTNFDINKFYGSTYSPLNRMNREYSVSTQEVFDRADSRF